MNSVIQIFKNLAEDDEARVSACVANFQSGSCQGINCIECHCNNHDSMQRAVNILINKLGG